MTNLYYRIINIPVLKNYILMELNSWLFDGTEMTWLTKIWDLFVSDWKLNFKMACVCELKIFLA